MAAIVCCLRRFYFRSTCSYVTLACDKKGKALSTDSNFCHQTIQDLKNGLLFFAEK